MDGNGSPEIAACVRRNAASAGLAAACLLYFGFWSGVVPLTRGAEVLQITIRIGGVVMLLIAAASLTGLRAVLFADAVASVGIGVGLGVSVLLMAQGGLGDSSLILYALFAAMFISAGVRNGRTFAALRPPGPREPPGLSTVLLRDTQRFEAHSSAPPLEPSSPRPKSVPDAPLVPPPDIAAGGYLAGFARREKTDEP